jgi:hypothetical protein
MTVFSSSVGSSKLPVSPPASPEASLASPERLFSPSSQTMHIQTLNEGFQVPLQRREEDIGEYNADYFDNQEATLFASTSSCDDLEEHEFHEGDYESEDSMGLEECWWPQKCLYNVESLKKKLHLREGERKRKKGTERIASPLQTAGEGEPILPSSLPPLQAHEHLQDHEPGGCSQGGL